MTSNQYVKRYKLRPGNQALADILNDLIHQFYAAQNKKVKVAASIYEKACMTSVWPFHILEELDLKWREFVGEIQDSNLNPGAFEKLIEKEFPVIYGAWITSKSLVGCGL